MVAPGRLAIAGFAWAGEADIARVDVSTDGGATWTRARLTGPALAYTWRRFECDVELKNAGSYTIKGNVLTTRPLVAKNEGVMRGDPQNREFKVEGAALWLITRPPAGQTGAETRTKLTRVE